MKPQSSGLIVERDPAAVCASVNISGQPTRHEAYLLGCQQGPAYNPYINLTSIFHIAQLLLPILLTASYEDTPRPLELDMSRAPCICYVGVSIN